jgi:hypothetical protein
MTTTDVRSSAIEALAGRIFSTGVRAAELCTAYLGIHLRLYRSLADSPATPTALAERTGCDESFTAPGDEIERFCAAASVIWCLPQGRVGHDPEPVGTLRRPVAMLDLARRVGYADGQILPIQHPVWQFYRLVP